MKKIIFSTVLVSMFCFSSSATASELSDKVKSKGAAAAESAKNTASKAAKTANNTAIDIKSRFGFGRSTDAAGSLGEVFGRKYSTDFSEFSGNLEVINKELDELKSNWTSAIVICGLNADPLKKSIDKAKKETKHASELMKNIASAQRQALIKDAPRPSEHPEAPKFLESISSLSSSVLSEDVSNNPKVSSLRSSYLKAVAAAELAEKKYEEEVASAKKTLADKRKLITESAERLQASASSLEAKIHQMVQNKTISTDFESTNDKHFQTIGAAYKTLEYTEDYLGKLSTESLDIKNKFSSEE